MKNTAQVTYPAENQDAAFSEIVSERSLPPTSSPGDECAKEKQQETRAPLATLKLSQEDGPPLNLLLLRCPGLVGLVPSERFEQLVVALLDGQLVVVVWALPLLC